MRHTMGDSAWVDQVADTHRRMYAEDSAGDVYYDEDEPEFDTISEAEGR